MAKPKDAAPQARSFEPTPSGSTRFQAAGTSALPNQIPTNNSRAAPFGLRPHVKERPKDVSVDALPATATFGNGSDDGLRILLEPVEPTILFELMLR